MVVVKGKRFDLGEVVVKSSLTLQFTLNCGSALFDPFGAEEN
jgi:hypothetical protein